MACAAGIEIKEEVFKKLNFQEAFRGRSHEVSILVCGQTGVGKSTLINGMVGQRLRNVNDPGLIEDEDDAFSPGTNNVECTFATIQGRGITLKLKIWDSPGLQDGTNNEHQYLENMYRNCKNVDLVLYCMESRVCRWTDAEERAIKLLTQKFGPNFWTKTVFVMTKANMINKSKGYMETYFHNLLSRFHFQLRTEGIPEIKAKQVPGVAAGRSDIEDERYLWYVSNKAEEKSSKQDFLAEFWIQCIERITGKSRDRFMGSDQDASHCKDQRFEIKVVRMVSIMRSGNHVQVIQCEHVQVHMRSSGLHELGGRNPLQPKLTHHDNGRCTYDDDGPGHMLQPWFKCHTCWGNDADKSRFGVCSHCATTCHSGHRLENDGIKECECDCGQNKHQAAVCTWHVTRRNYIEQPFYRCYDCFNETNEGVCYQCWNICHHSHRTRYVGIKNAFCDCGLNCCRIKCRIPHPK